LNFLHFFICNYFCKVTQITEIIYQTCSQAIPTDLFEFTSTGNDPAFIFADYPTFKNTRAIRIEITTPAVTHFQFFFTSPEADHFVEKNSIVKLLPEGRSKSILYFSEAIISGKLRIDPGDLPGKYIIHHLEIGK